MSTHWTRRDVLRWSAAGGMAGALGGVDFLGRLPAVSAAETDVKNDIVQMQPEIEPLVRLLEDTPRNKLLEEVGSRVRAGLTYREVLAALLLAGVRNIQPRPSVGFKFHAVLVVNSAHLASMNSPAELRWLPIFWALDEFKSSQARDVQEGNWTMSAVQEKKVPSADKARQAFIDAMDQWDEEAADAAIAGLARNAGAGEIQELMYVYGSRDFRSIGHKAIYVANSFRTLHCIGWRYAEPVLRSLAYALQNRESGTNPAKSDLPADRAGRRNKELAQKLRQDWTSGRIDEAATREMIAALRSSSGDDCCDLAIEQINRGVSPQSVWDAVFVSGGELLTRQPGIVALHSMTSANALRYAFDASGVDDTRRVLLLQAVDFVTEFREAMKGRGRVGDAKLDELTAWEGKAGMLPTPDDIMTDVSKNNKEASQKVLAYLDGDGDPQALIDAARVLVFLKGRDSHDYKFSSAVLEDYYNISPAWRNRYLAAGVYNLQGSTLADNGLVKRTRAALEA